MRRHVAVLAVLAALVAPAAGATIAPTWATATTVNAAIQHAGAVRFSDGSRARILSVSLHGVGAYRGPLAAPRFRAFEGTLVTGRLGATTWYAVRVTLARGGYLLRVLFVA